MDLAGQGADNRQPPGVPRLDDGGYIMVVLLVSMAVTAVWMGAMLPAWRQQAVREKEAELIFRGEQYARAIALFWRKNNQTLPPNLDVLVSQRYLRKKYMDPITNGEFLPVATASGVTLGGNLGAQSPVGGGRGQPAAQAPPPLGLLGRGAGISGVRSTSTATSIIVYRGQQSHSQFPFDYNIALQQMGVGRGAGQPAAGPAGRGRFTGAPSGAGDELAPIQPEGGRGPIGGRGRLGAPIQAPAPR